MILKNSSILISLLLGAILTTVPAYPEYEDVTSMIQSEDSQNNDSDEILNSDVVLQQFVEPLLSMGMDAKTEITLKNVRNISNNQLSNEYISPEHEDEHIVDTAEEVDPDDNYKNNRISKLFTTTIPQYIRQIDQENPNLSKQETNASTFDYMEDEFNHTQQKHTIKMPVHKNLEKASEENDDNIPLAMKYYDEIAPENSDPPRHKDKLSSEDYYDEDEYNEPETTTTIKSTGTVKPKTTISPRILQIADSGILATLSSVITTSTNMNGPIITIPTPTPNPLTMAVAARIPTTSQFESSFTTLAPLPIPAQIQNQTLLGITASRIANAAVAAAAAAVSPSSSSSSSDKKGKQIPIISTLPVITTTTTATTRRRLLPHEQLRNYIEDAYIRMPLAVIVDSSPESLENTKALWNDAMRTDLNIKIILVTLNESEESPTAFNFNSSRQFLASLNSIKEQNGGDAFRGVSDAAELVPYDSAVFISTAKLAKHTDQVQESAITLLKKRIRLYLIWFGERSLSENETQDSIGGILGEVAIRSGGEILHIVSGENSQELEASTLTIVADALRGSQEVGVPVDTTLSSLHVKIDKHMRKAVLETPNGEINLKKLVKFKTHELTTFDDDDNRLDAYVPLTKLSKATIYKLKLIPENVTTEYSVFIRGERKADLFIDDIIKHIETYLFERHTSYPARLRNGKLEQNLVTDAIDATHSKIQFPPNDKNKSIPKSEVETFSVHEVNQNPMNNNEPNNISSLTATTWQPQQKNYNFLFKTNTKIEMGLHSQILLTPGILSQLYFEVTNTGYEPNYYNIQVVDERRYLIRLNPRSLFLQPGQMNTVTVSLFAPQNTQANTIDHITFSTTTPTTTASLTVNLKVLTPTDAQDNTSPSISWTFGSRCEGLSNEFDYCSERFWNMYITAQDFQTGIMRLQAIPSSGLIYTKTYTVGTTEPLKATYIASCCDTKVSLVAFDGAGNQRSHVIDVRDLVLTEASIAAIVLGVILLILLIILLIVAIRWYCRRRKIVLDLPTYRSHSTRSME